MKRPGRTCATAHCSTVVTSGSYCRRCLQTKRATRPTPTGKSSAFREQRPEYRSADYRRARAAQIERTPYCQLDHLAGCSGGLQVHHVNGNAKDNRPANLSTLCQRHHMQLEGQGKAGRLARALARTLNGET
jgi:hypothetical protein